MIIMILWLAYILTANVETNNCTHMSKRLEGIMETIGIPVTIEVGARYDGSRHMWISLWNKIDIDSVCLLPFLNSEYNLKHKEYESYDEYEKTR